MSMASDRVRDCKALGPGQVLQCDSCDYRGVFRDAVSHYRETGHLLTWKGVVQDFARVVKESDELDIVYAAHQQAIEDDRNGPEAARARGLAWREQLARQLPKA